MSIGICSYICSCLFYPCPFCINSHCFLVVLTMCCLTKLHTPVRDDIFLLFATYCFSSCSVPEWVIHSRSPLGCPCSGVSLLQGVPVPASISLARNASPAEQCEDQLCLRAGVPVVAGLPGRTIWLQARSDGRTPSPVPQPAPSHSNMVPCPCAGGQMATEP